jgi:hypothetical protein
MQMAPSHRIRTRLFFTVFVLLFVWITALTEKKENALRVQCVKKPFVLSLPTPALPGSGIRVLLSQLAPAPLLFSSTKL